VERQYHKITCPHCRGRIAIPVDEIHPSSGRGQYTEEQVLKAIYESGLHQYAPGVLRTQLEEANHTVERLVSEAANTPELLKQLAIARDALERISKSTECERHQGGGWTTTYDAGIARKALKEMEG
jgi:hypothetical protein